MNVMGTQSFDSNFKIIDGKGDDRETGRDWIARRKRSALEDDQKSAAEIEMRAMAIVHQQFQPDDITIEMCRSGNIFSPQADDGKLWWHDVLHRNKTTSAMNGWS